MVKVSLLTELQRREICRGRFYRSLLSEGWRLRFEHEDGALLYQAFIHTNGNSMRLTYNAGEVIFVKNGKFLKRVDY